jgi:hypothetical protein
VPVTPVILPVISPVTPIVVPVLAPFANLAEQAGSILSISQQSHLHAPFSVAWRSASTAAISACVGIRPLVTS